jgi:cytochrome b561
MRHSRADYSHSAKLLHWAVAVIVMGLIPVGVVMGDLPQGALQNRLFALHESFGVTVLALMSLRLFVRLRGAPPPDPGLSRTQRIVASAVHHALYLFLFLTPLLGWLALSAYGLGPSFFGLGELPALLSKNEPLSKTLFTFHALCGFLVAGLVVLHIAGIVRHALLKQGDIVSRMLWARTSS